MPLEAACGACAISKGQVLVEKKWHKQPRRKTDAGIGSQILGLVTDKSLLKELEK